MEKSAVKVTLDWNAYYRKFKELNGDPVPYRGRLLFPNGWTYSASDPAGPEWPAPTDAAELKNAQIAYWSIRRAVCNREYRHLLQLVEGLEQLQGVKSCPLQQSVMRFDDETGKRATAKVDVDTKTIRAGRIEWLENDIKECDQKLKGLKGTKQHGTSVSSTSV